MLPITAGRLANAAALLSLATANANAQTAAEPGRGSTTRAFVSVTPVAQLPAGLDAGGDMSAAGVLTRFGFTSALTPSLGAGLAFAYDYNDYDFSGAGLLASGGPWNVVQRVGLSAPLVFRGGPQWSFGVTPSVDAFGENGAEWSESLSYGATVFATREFGERRRLGFGVGVYQRPEQTVAFPFLAVDWALSERLRLTNPLTAGPTGPAGLELRYRFDGGWEGGIGAAYRSYRFRLAQDGPVPNGIGEEDGVPLFLRVSRSLGPAFSLDLYAGAILGGKLKVEDSSGTQVASSDFASAPLLGLTFSARF